MEIVSDCRDGNNPLIGLDGAEGKRFPGDRTGFWTKQPERDGRITNFRENLS
jgi:hypothetical protein